MENHTLFIEQSLNELNGELFRMSHIRITTGKGKFPHRALRPYILVKDSVREVKGLLTDLSGNQKELHGWFTTDAFQTVDESVTILFGYGSEITGEFKAVRIHEIMMPLADFLSSVPATIADNAWLENLSENN